MKKNKYYLYIFCIACLSPLNSFAQFGVAKVFDFVHLPSNPRLSALGGSLVSVQDDDVALAAINPALLNERSHHELSINHEFHFAGINYGYTAYGYHFDSLALTIHGAAHYVDYGEFVRADIFGEKQGTFDASEVAFTLGAAKKLNDRISLGVNLRAINANYAEYGSFALSGDVGIHYTNPAKSFEFGAVWKNVGTQLNPFYETKDKLRQDVQIGFSKRLKYLPFRYSIIAHNLQQWNLRYSDPSNLPTDIFGNVIEEKNSLVIIDNFFRHIIVNGEFLLGKREQIRLRLAYNHLRKAELSVASLNSLAGFSFGFGINVKKIKIDYGVSLYHLEGGTNHLGIRMNFVDMFIKRV